MDLKHSYDNTSRLINSSKNKLSLLYISSLSRSHSKSPPQVLHTRLLKTGFYATSPSRLFSDSSRIMPFSLRSPLFFSSVLDSFPKVSTRLHFPKRFFDIASRFFLGIVVDSCCSISTEKWLDYSNWINSYFQRDFISSMFHNIDSKILGSWLLWYWYVFFFSLNSDFYIEFWMEYPKILWFIIMKEGNY